MDLAKKTLVWLADGREGYGVASTIEAFSGALQRRGWQIVAICQQQGALFDRLPNCGIVTYELGNASPRNLPVGRLSRISSYLESRRAEARMVKGAEKLLSACNVVAVETCSALLVNAVGQLAKAKNAIPIWRMAGNVSSRRGVNFGRLLLQASCWRGGVMAMGNSQFTTASLGFGPARKQANLHGCDASRFDPANISPVRRSDLGIPTGAIVFGMVARFDPSGDKGQLRFLQALLASKLVAEKNIHLLLLGGPVDGEFSKQIRQAAQRANVGGHVHLPGAVTDPARYYPIMDVSVNCRLTAEPFGLSVIEAMMMGIPVLAHSLGGPSETIRDSETGWLCHSVEVEDLTQAISRVLEQQSQWSEMGLAARAHTLKHFTLEKEVDRWLECVRNYR